MGKQLKKQLKKQCRWRKIYRRKNLLNGNPGQFACQRKIICQYFEFERKEIMPPLWYTKIIEFPCYLKSRF